MVTILLSLCLFLLSRPAQADELIDPRTWWSQLPESQWQSQPSLIRNLTIRTTQPARARRWDKVLQDFSSLGFLQYIPIEDMDFIQRLNPNLDLGEMPNELKFDPELLQMVLTDRGTKMSVLINSGKTYKSLGSWPITPQDRLNAQGVLDWLSRNLGYDAVVLDFRNGLILAGLLKNTSELGQGLLVKKSARRWLIKESNARGEALLQILKIDGSLAILEVLLAKGESLEVEKGSKILLGQNNNWMKIIQQGTAQPKLKTAPPAAPTTGQRP